MFRLIFAPLRQPKILRTWLILLFVEILLFFNWSTLTLTHNSQLVRDFFSVLVNLFPLLLLLAAWLIKSRLRYFTMLISTAFLVPSLIFLLFNLMDIYGTDYSNNQIRNYELIQRAKINGIGINLYRFNCGVLCPFVMRTFAERDLFLGFRLSKEIFKDYKCGEGKIDEVDSTQLEVVTCNKSVIISPKDFSLLNFSPLTN